MYQKLLHSLAKIRETKPLVLNLTNLVTMDIMANCLLALGAAPIMSTQLDEMEELAAISGAININMGTLYPNLVEMTEQLAKSNKPIVLDPVAVGATKIRTQTAMQLLPYCDIIRGNASEIMALSGLDSRTLGVESVHDSQEAMLQASSLAENHIVVISGPTDYVLHGKAQTSLPFGSKLMPYITGMGCSLTAIIAAFTAVNDDFYEASCLATAFYGLCGEQASIKANGPASFRSAFIDELYNPNLDFMQQKLEELNAA